MRKVLTVLGLGMVAALLVGIFLQAQAVVVLAGEPAAASRAAAMFVGLIVLLLILALNAKKAPRPGGGRAEGPSASSGRLEVLEDDSG